LDLNILDQTKLWGGSGIRRYALEFIESNLHLILDDDSVFYNKKTIEEILSSIDLIKEKNVGSIIFPAYNRLPFPTSFVSLDKIGKINMNKGINSWFLTSFPDELISVKDQLPLIPISLGSSYGIYNTLALKKVGGFKSGGKNDYAMESELVWRLKNKGYNSFYSPDPKKGCLHLKFGVKSSFTSEKVLNLIPLSDLKKIELILGNSLENMLNIQINETSLSEMIAYSNCINTSGGCRNIKENDWVKNKIANEFAQIIRYYPFSKKVAGIEGYIIRMIKQAQNMKISRRGNLNLSCNLEKNLNKFEQTLNVVEGLICGVGRGLGWYIICK
jgi:hypothetical protein